LPCVLLSTAIPALFWLMIKGAFQDDYKLSFTPICLFFLLEAMGLYFYAESHLAINWLPVVGERKLFLILQASKFAWCASALWVVCRDWQADLVELRRNLRSMLVVFIGGYILLVVIVEIATFSHTPPTWLEVFNSGFIFVLTMLFAFSALSIDQKGFLQQILQDNVVIEGLAHSENKTALLTILESERPIDEQKVIEQMEKLCVYRENGLTVKSLAQQLGMQEYRLRLLINQNMGYRNFNEFVNGYRIDDVVRKLSSKEHNNTPILTLALDAGFSSIAPFNKAFKEKMAATPSEYRQSYLKTLNS